MRVNFYSFDGQLQKDHQFAVDSTAIVAVYQAVKSIVDQTCKDEDAVEWIISKNHIYIFTSAQRLSFQRTAEGSNALRWLAAVDNGKPGVIKPLDGFSMHSVLTLLTMAPFGIYRLEG